MMMINGGDGTTWSIGRDGTLSVYRKGFFVYLDCVHGGIPGAYRRWGCTR
jgi:hypothetical protein